MGTRNRNELNSKKREREVIIEQRQNKRPREDIIELSSDADELPRPIVSARRIIPVTVDSTTDESSDLDEDLENTLVDDVDLFIAEKSTSSESDQSRDVSASSSGTGSPADKGKGKEVMVEQFLDIQEELECFICCLLPLENYFTDGSDSVTSSPYLFPLWSCRLLGLQYFP